MTTESVAELLNQLNSNLEKIATMIKFVPGDGVWAPDKYVPSESHDFEEAKRLVKDNVRIQKELAEEVRFYHKMVVHLGKHFSAVSE